MSFESGASVTYIFQEPFSVIQNRSAAVLSVPSQYSKTRDNMALSFQTTQSPAMLLTVNTLSQQYVAIVLARNGETAVQTYIILNAGCHKFMKGLYVYNGYCSTKLITYVVPYYLEYCTARLNLKKHKKL